MTFMLGLLGKWGVPPEMRRLLLGVLGIGLVMAILFTAKCSYDHKLIANHDSKVEASAAKADRKADETAATQRRVDDARLVQERQQLKEVLNDPAITTERDRNRAFHRCLRLQQAARADGKQPPACL